MRPFYLFLLAGFAAILLFGCQEKPATTEQANNQASAVTYDQKKEIQEGITTKDVVET